MYKRLETILTGNGGFDNWKSQRGAESPGTLAALIGLGGSGRPALQRKALDFPVFL
jgi:hypothetical protein